MNIKHKAVYDISRTFSCRRGIDIHLAIVSHREALIKEENKRRALLKGLAARENYNV